MDTRLHPAAVAPGMIPQPIIVIGALVLCSVVYSLASGSGSGRDLESDRMVVAQCWNSIDRRGGGDDSRRALIDGCERMERGFHLKYGATL